MRFNKLERKMVYKFIIALILGVLFIFFGILQCLIGFGILRNLGEILFIPQDIIGGFISILIGIIFLTGVYELQTGISEGIAYVYVGILLALFFLSIYILIILANAIEAYIFLNEDFQNWSPLDEIRPLMIIATIGLFIFIYWRSKIKRQKGK